VPTQLAALDAAALLQLRATLRRVTVLHEAPAALLPQTACRPTHDDRAPGYIGSGLTPPAVPP